MKRTLWVRLCILSLLAISLAGRSVRAESFSISLKLDYQPGAWSDGPDGGGEFRVHSLTGLTVPLPSVAWIVPVLLVAIGAIRLVATRRSVATAAAHH